MGRAPCCEKVGLKKGRWTAEEDQTLIDYIHANGEGSWRSLPKNSGLLRCGKSCRLRWINYLRADLKRGDITPQEEDIIIRLHASMGNRWSTIASQLPGRTDNEIKNYWNSHLSRKIDAFRRPANMMSIPFSATSSSATAPDETKTATTKLEPPSNKRKERGGRTSRKTMKKNKITYKSSATTTKSSPPMPSLSASTGPIGATGPSALGINEGGEEEMAFEDLMMVDEMIVDPTGVLALIGERQISLDGDDVTGATIKEGDVDGELLRGPNNVTANCDTAPASRNDEENENRLDRTKRSSSGSNSNSKSSFDGDEWYNSCSNYYHAGESTSKFNEFDGVNGSTVDDQMGWDWEISDIFKHESLLNMDENKDDGNYMLSWLWDQNAADDDNHANPSNESRSSEELADKNDAILAWLLS